MPSLLLTILIILLIFNIFSELFSVSVFGLLRLGIGAKTKFISQKKHRSVQEKKALRMKNIVSYALTMSIVRIIVPIVIIISIFNSQSRIIYLYTMLFFIVLEILTYQKWNFKLYATPRSANQINIPYLLIIFVCVVGYFG